jgi:hypothetical protein
VASPNFDFWWRRSVSHSSSLKLSFQKSTASFQSRCSLEQEHGRDDVLGVAVEPHQPGLLVLVEVEGVGDRRQEGIHAARVRPVLEVEPVEGEEGLRLVLGEPPVGHGT